MANIESSIRGLRLLDDFARKDSAVHHIHPLILFLVTITYSGIMSSFGKYAIVPMLPFVLYPVIVFSVSRIPIKPILKRALIVMPLILGIGLFAVIFDRSVIYFGANAYYGGWFNFASLVIKYGLIVITALLMMSTMGIDKLAYALRMIRIPKLIVLQILLTYRYISVIGEEIAKTIRAYKLRSYGKKGVHKTAWGPLVGQIILRAYERSQYIYRAMLMRGFDGNYHPSTNIKMKFKDVAYLLCWIAFFVLARIYDIPTLLGNALAGVL
jgi:cobalt/nickel transport system permease protein